MSITALSALAPSADPSGAAQSATAAPVSSPPAGGFAGAVQGARLAAVHATQKASAGEEFEAVTLTSFVQLMLPPDDSVVWGGSAGRLWRGVFAQHLAADIAAQGGVGIADIINTMLEEREGDPS